MAAWRKTSLTTAEVQRGNPGRELCSGEPLTPLTKALRGGPFGSGRKHSKGDEMTDLLLEHDTRNPYDAGRRCGKAKRWCVDNGKALETNENTHEKLNTRISLYDRLAQEERSRWFADFYRGIADELRLTQP